MHKNDSIQWVMIFLIFSGVVSLASASVVDTSQYQWGNGTSGTLTRGEEMTYMGYTVKVVAFSAPVESGKYDERPAEPVLPFVGMNISKNGIFIGSAALGQGESYVVPDGELKVTAEQLPSQDASEWLYESYNPWATLSLDPRGTPLIEVSLGTDSDEYSSSSAGEIEATVTLENTGSADAINVDLNLNTGLEVKKGNLKYHYDKLKKGESVTNTITFSIPVLMERKYYTLSANVSGYDVKDIPYTQDFSTTILIIPEPLESPILRKSTNPKIYLKDYAMVTLSLKNNANYDLENVSINDSIPAGFKLVGNQSLHWVTNISANGEWDFRYLIKPQKANKGGIALPAATAEFLTRKEYYIIKSNQPEITINGPRISLKKQTDVSEIRPGDNVIVKIVAQNEGNTPTKVSIKDKLPKEGTLVKGGTSYEEFLEANKTVSFSYTITINSEKPVKLPPAVAEYFELGTVGEKISAKSKEVEINIKNPDEIATDLPTPEVPPEILETPIIDLDNSTDSKEINGSDGFVSNAGNESIIYSILKYLLGCDNNTGSLFNGSYNPCKLFLQNKSDSPANNHSLNIKK